MTRCKIKEKNTMKKINKYLSFLVIPIIKIILYMKTSEKIKYGEILFYILGKYDWQKKQKEAFNVSIDLLENTLPEKNISKVYNNINRVYLAHSIENTMDYCLTPCKILLIFYKEGFTDNHRYLSSLLVRCAYEMENFDLPKKERKKKGRIAQLDCLSNFSGEDIDFFKDRLLDLIKGSDEGSL